VDANGDLITSSPSTRAPTLREAEPALLPALKTATAGQVSLAGTSNTFVVAPVAGITWRLVMTAPNDKLFASIRRAPSPTATRRPCPCS
jgi:hypothetical protein